ncbi:MAG: HEAT repeat domain-containing protein [Planctomycetota bacterium]|nr:HEAT repeat domain-containing protein [Planctomycetota bacterium]
MQNSLEPAALLIGALLFASNQLAATTLPTKLTQDSAGTNHALSTDQDYAPTVQSASGEGASRLLDFDTGDGLEVRLWAAEPLLANPVCLTIDEKGDIYVGETFRHTDGVLDIREHTDWLADDFACETVEARVALMERILGDGFEAMGEEHERIRLLTDTNRDGQADTSIVYADGFAQPAVGIGAGLLAHQGEVFYTCIPELWSLRDSDGDGIAETKKILSQGYGVRIGYLGHDLHGLRLGHDGRLWFSIGDRGLHVETESNTLHLPNTGAVLRCEPDGSELEIMHTGLRNPQELAFNDFGDLFVGDNNADNGDRARIVQIIEGGDSGWRGPYQWVANAGYWNSENRWHTWHETQPAFLLPPLDHLSAGPSGFTHEPGATLTAEYADNFFLCDFQGTQSGSGIFAFELLPEGAGFSMSEPTQPLWGLLATDCEFGPDGALYVTDWVQGWGKTGKGRVYRLSDAEPDTLRANLIANTRELLRLGMDQRPDSELSQLLSHGDARVRLAAQLELTTRGSSGLAALSKVAQAPADQSLEDPQNSLVLDRNDLSTLHALWGLGILARRDEASRDACVDVLLDVATNRMGEVRAQAIKTLGDLREPSAASLCISSLEDPAPRVRREAALACGRIRASEAVEPLAKLVRDVGNSDPVLRHAGTMGLLGCADAMQLETLARDEHREARLAALLVMRRRESAALTQFLDDPDPLLVHEAARAIHDGPVEAALPDLANRLLNESWHDRFGLKDGEHAIEEGSGDPDLLWRRSMNAAYHIGGQEYAEQLVRFAQLQSIDAALRAEAIDLLGTWGQPDPLDRLTGYYWPISERDDSAIADLALALSELVDHETPDEVLISWAKLVQGLAVAEEENTPALSEEIAEQLAKLTSKQSAGVAARVSALQALEVIAPDNLKEIVSFALESQDPEIRAAALSALESLSLSDVMPRLPALLDHGEMPEHRMALRILGEADDPRADEWLAGELRKLRSHGYPEELTLDLVLAAESRESPTVQALLAENSDQNNADSALAPWMNSLFGGDATLGRAVFEQTEMQCVRCHEADEGATAVGPNLTEVSKRLSRLQILEALIAPNRRTAPGYGASKVVLNDDRVLSGRILEEGLGEDGILRLTLQDSNGVITEIPVANVSERQPGISAMPEGLAAGLTRAQMRDLIEYVANQ